MREPICDVINYCVLSCDMCKGNAHMIMWMCSNRLQLNTAKTDVLWCATRRRQHQIPREPTRGRVGTDFVQSARSVRDLGIYLDS